MEFGSVHSGKAESKTHGIRTRQIEDAFGVLSTCFHHQCVGLTGECMREIVVNAGYASKGEKRKPPKMAFLCVLLMIRGIYVIHALSTSISSIHNN